MSSGGDAIVLWIVTIDSIIQGLVRHNTHYSGLFSIDQWQAEERTFSEAAQVEINRTRLFFVAVCAMFSANAKHSAHIRTERPNHISVWAAAAVGWPAAAFGPLVAAGPGRRTLSLRHTHLRTLKHLTAVSPCRRILSVRHTHTRILSLRYIHLHERQTHTRILSLRHTHTRILSLRHTHVHLHWQTYGSVRLQTNSEDWTNKHTVS